MYNALVALPLCLVGATLKGEWNYIANFPHVNSMVSSEFNGVCIECSYISAVCVTTSSGSQSFWLALTLASLLGCLMTYVVFLSTTVNSPLGEHYSVLAVFRGEDGLYSSNKIEHTYSRLFMLLLGLLLAWASLPSILE